MTGIGKVAVKCAVGLALAFTAGYLEYRAKGGEPIRKLYQEAKQERVAMQAILDRQKKIVLEQKDYKVE